MLLTSVTYVSRLSKPTVNIQNVCVNTYICLVQALISRRSFSLTVDERHSVFSRERGKRFINFYLFPVLQRDYCRILGHTIPCLYTDAQARGEEPDCSQLSVKELGTTVIHMFGSHNKCFLFVS